MAIPENLQTAAMLWAGVGGTAGVGVALRGVYRARAEKRAVDSATAKTSAEAVTELSGTMVAILTSAPGEIARLSARLREADLDIERLTVRIRAQADEIDGLNRQLEMRSREASALKAEMDHLSAQLTLARIELSQIRTEHGGEY